MVKRGQRWQPAKISGLKNLLVLFGLSLAGFLCIASPSSAVLQQQSGSTGVEGLINGPPPTQAPTITVPGSGQTFSNIPITVSGLCPKGLLVEVFKNGVFSGS